MTVYTCYKGHRTPVYVEELCLLRLFSLRFDAETCRVPEDAVGVFCGPIIP